MGKLTGVVVGGQTTFAAILPHLITIAQREGFYRRAVWLCRCDSGPCSEVPASDDGPAELPGGAWSVCPYGVLRGVQFRAVQTLAECAKVSPIAGWPWGIPAWLAWGVTLYQARTGGDK